MKTTQFTLTLEAAPSEPGTPDAGVRLRRLLKELWRTHRLRCVAMTEAPQPGREAPGSTLTQTESAL